MTGSCKGPIPPALCGPARPKLLQEYHDAVRHPSEQGKRIKLTLCSSKSFLLLFFLNVEQEKGKASKALLPASAPECKDLEKQALEIEFQRQENQAQQHESKMTWKEWFKNPDFYKVKYDFCT